MTNMLNNMRFICLLFLAAMLVSCAGDSSLSANHVLEIKAFTCLEAGWLEQIACSPNSREHEALLVINAVPSEIHAALLLAGFVSGAPGKWFYEDGELKFTQPTGSSLTIQVRYTNSAGKTIQEPISKWIRDPVNQSKFPDEPWVFGGSEFRNNPESMGPGEHYVADFTGSIIGLVTFGDEVIGFRRVISDQETVHAPQWQVNTDRVPPFGTEVTLIISQADSS